MGGVALRSIEKKRENKADTTNTYATKTCMVDPLRRLSDPLWAKSKEKCRFCCKLNQVIIRK